MVHRGQDDELKDGDTSQIDQPKFISFHPIGMSLAGQFKGQEGRIIPVHARIRPGNVTGIDSGTIWCIAVATTMTPGARTHTTHTTTTAAGKGEVGILSRIESGSIGCPRRSNDGSFLCG